MSKEAGKRLVLGFLKVVTVGQGYRGGYLLVSEFGRPIEFHYTNAVHVSSQQQTLYGDQFEPFIFAETIGKPLTDRQSVPPAVIAVMQPGLLALRRLIPAPLLMVTANPAGGWQAVSHADHPAEAGMFEKLTPLVPAGFDWHEPFARIDRALEQVTDVDAGRRAA